MSKHSASIVRSLSKKFFGIKHMAYGKILDQWKQIIGDKYADKAEPIAVRYRKDANKETVCILKIQTNSALAMQLGYQKGVILERINMLIGKPRFVDILFEHQSFATVKEAQAPFSTKKRVNTRHMNDDLEQMIKGIDDESLRQSLIRYMTSATN